jgi:hypothetical protein
MCRSALYGPLRSAIRLSVSGRRETCIDAKRGHEGGPHVGDKLRASVRYNRERNAGGWVDVFVPHPGYILVCRCLEARHGKERFREPARDDEYVVMSAILCRLHAGKVHSEMVKGGPHCWQWLEKTVLDSQKSRIVRNQALLAEQGSDSHVRRVCEDCEGLRRVRQGQSRLRRQRVDERWHGGRHLARPGECALRRAARRGLAIRL